ncbi:MAG: hypothetical protein ACRECD_11950 [Burkholderiaceae bacterium]
MGSGKSTTMRLVAKRMEESNLRVKAIHERTDPHPVRATDELEHWFRPWLDATPAQLADSSVAKWRAFAESAKLSDSVPVIDGQLFHGDLTNLFLMEASFEDIASYIKAVASAIAPLRPLLIYFHQDDIGRAIRLACAERGEEWVKHQTEWKLAAPYGVRRGLKGIDGLVALYEDYRRLTDKLFECLDVDKVAIENSERNWPAYNQLVFDRLGLSAT